MTHDPNDATPPVILVTGAARRVGAAIAGCLHQAGATVVLHFQRSGGEAEALARTLNAVRPGSASTVHGNLGEDGVPEAVIATALARHGRLDGLINNASSFFPTPLGSIDSVA